MERFQRLETEKLNVVRQAAAAEAEATGLKEETVKMDQERDNWKAER